MMALWFTVEWNDTLISHDMRNTYNYMKIWSAKDTFCRVSKETQKLIRNKMLIHNMWMCLKNAFSSCVTNLIR